jgi:hypothetical protein
MAIRTISNAGGNYNATGTWVEGVVPTTADDIVATATSGQLTINVASAARTINLTNYNNTITMNNTWTVTGSALSSMIGSSTTTYAGTVGFLSFTGTSHTLSQEIGSSRIPNFRSNTNTRTLTTDIYVTNFQTSGSNATFNGNTLFVNGNFGDPTVSTSGTTISGIVGTTRFVLSGVGSVNATLGATGLIVPVNFEITGSYSTPFGNMLVLANGASFSSSSTSTISGINLNIYRASIGVNNDNLWINTNSKGFNNLILTYYTVNNAFPLVTINLTQPLIFNNLLSSPIPRIYTIDNTVTTFEFLGSFLSASNVSLLPIYRTNSSTTSPVITYRGPEIRLASGLTHSIGAIQAIGGLGSILPGNTNALIRSTVAGSRANINLGSETASQIINYNFTDINAVGRQIVAINGTFSNTTNITNVYPSGGGGTSSVSGGSWTFVN